MEKDFMKDPRLRYVGADPGTGLQVFLYRPTLFRPLYAELTRMRFKRRVRFFLEYMHRGHYSVYYAVLDSKIIGYNVIAPGGRRLAGTAAEDAVTGPSYILPAYRNRGYNRIMKKIAFRDCGCANIYCWVHKDNLPSAASLTRFGFTRCGEVRERKGLIKKQVPAANGESVVFRYEVAPEDREKITGARE